MLLRGAPGCGKTQIAKVLSHEAGLNFIALSTSDCKAMFIGWSADRLAKVFTQARAKSPSLIYIDEIDAVCPPRGAHHDVIPTEFMSQLLTEIDGINSDGDAIFLIGSTNRPDQVDSAILSRFSERIEIGLPDEPTREALLELFLSPLPFSGDRTHVIRRLARESTGMSERALRGLVNLAVLAAVKRCPLPKEFSLSDSDFALPAPTKGAKPIITMQSLKILLALLLLSMTAAHAQIGPTKSNPEADKVFFSGVKLGLSIQQARAYYQKLGNVALLWHSGAPPGEEQVDFRTSTSPQRLVYVYYRKADDKIVSVSYWKLGKGETFSKAERNYLLKLNGNHANLILKTLGEGSELGSECEIATPHQYQIEAASQQ